MHIIEQLKQAEKTYLLPADQQMIKGWKIEAYESMNIESLENIEGIRILQNWLEKELAMIAQQLLNDRKMTELERALAFSRTDWINDILKFFKEKDLDKLKEQINQLTG